MGNELSCRRCGKRQSVDDLRNWDERKAQTFLVGEGCPLCLAEQKSPPDTSGTTARSLEDSGAQDASGEVRGNTQVGPQGGPMVERIRRLAQPRPYKENFYGLGALAAAVAALVLPTRPQMNLVVALVGVALGLLGRRRTRRHLLATAGLLLSAVVVWVEVVRFVMGH